jgi:bifunctional UDP-N-acetylglucosamine pyrophosphorylase / glucosamine-1-phosphate N-acetyltransferase
MDIMAVVLAGGKGKRMGAGVPKVLRPYGNKPMISCVIDAVSQVVTKGCCVVLAKDYGPFVAFIDSHPDLGVVLQHEAKGTADAVACSYLVLNEIKAPHYADATLLRTLSDQHSQPDALLICTADTPRLQAQTLKKFLDSMWDADFGVIGCRMSEPKGYGRLVTGSDQSLIKIVEEKDANAEEKKITLVNSGVVFARVKPLFEALGNLQANNNAKEFYLTDIFAAKVRKKVFEADHAAEFMGVNTPEELASINQVAY